MPVTIKQSVDVVVRRGQAKGVGEVSRYLSAATSPCEQSVWNLWVHGCCCAFEDGHSDHSGSMPYHCTLYNRTAHCSKALLSTAAPAPPDLLPRPQPSLPLAIHHRYFAVYDGYFFCLTQTLALFHFVIVSLHFWACETAVSFPQPCSRRLDSVPVRNHQNGAREPHGGNFEKCPFFEIFLYSMMHCCCAEHK